MTNFERIKGMSVDELAEFLNNVFQHEQEGIFLTYSQVKEYLESEVEE